jgi:carboxylesterase
MAEKRRVGLLILHGFTGSLDTVRCLVPAAEARGWAWRMPVLRGHGTRHEDLVGVRWGDWVADAEAALAELRAEAETIVVAGLSMGGLVTLTLAHRHPEAIAGVVTLAPCLRFADPLAGFTPLIKLFVPFWPSPNAYTDPACRAASTNYKKFPTATFGELLDLATETERLLGAIQTPVHGIFARKDTITHAIVAHLLETKLGGPVTTEHFEASGHELLSDGEAAAVCAAVMAAAGRLAGQAAPA